MNLSEELIKYKNLTLELITSVEKEEYDNLDNLLTNRQNVIAQINELTYSKDEFLYLCKDLDILVLNQKLIKISNQKKSEIRKHIDELRVSKNANKGYNKKFAVDSVFFNKKT
ncbi:flagellar protein FliT [Clostridium sp. BSD9I1]|uniref:flagellar protein FliT n=1 Tax=Clostridium sp. BSD9I1 TaxID=2003589 RepID=UPI00164414EE|nr:flagellar protein FliT [Clostridium sp. BSD9I1]